MKFSFTSVNYFSTTCARKAKEIISEHTVGLIRCWIYSDFSRIYILRRSWRNTSFDHVVFDISVVSHDAAVIVSRVCMAVDIFPVWSIVSSAFAPFPVSQPRKAFLITVVALQPPAATCSNSRCRAKTK